MAYLHLTIEERERIRGMCDRRDSRRSIAKQLKRSPSTISRELRRNCPAGSNYAAYKAHRCAKQRRTQPHRPHLLDDKTLWDLVVKKMQLGWSPEQVNGRLKLELGLSISYRTIYRRIDRERRLGDPNGILANLPRCPRRRRKHRRPKGRAGIVGRVGLEARPPEVALRKTVGDWEGDTIVGGNFHGAVATYVERKSRFVIASVLPDRNSQSLVQRSLLVFRKHSCARQRRTMTLDNGLEFADFKKLQRGLRIKVFFAPPYQPWHRATMENTNGLLRHYLPKKMDLRTVTQTALNTIVRSLNNRPRKCLNWQTPAEVFSQQPP